jgi:hypothetical protein
MLELGAADVKTAHTNAMVRTMTFKNRKNFLIFASFVKP